METQTDNGEPRAARAARAEDGKVAVAGEPRNAALMFAERAAKSGPRTALRRKVGGVWEEITWAQWEQAAREVAAGLAALGIGRGDRVCLLASTRAEWVFCDVGILLAGAATVPIYQSNTPEQCEYIVRDSGAKVVIAEDPAQLDKLLGQLDRVDLLICDELGHRTFSRSGAELLFQVFADRYERKSLLITSNLAFSEWTTIFHGERMTAALLDRLTHHCQIFEMNGESYRFRESMKSKRKKS